MPSDTGLPWLRGLNLVERIALLAWGREPSTERSVRHSASTARHRLAQWRAQSPFQDPTWFQRRLEADGLQHEAALLAMLDPPWESLLPQPATTFWPPWVGQMERLASVTATAAPGSAAMALGLSDFATVAAPLGAPARAALRERAERLARASAQPPFEPAQAVEQLWAQAAHWIDLAVARTIALELGIARLEDRLAGEAPAERYCSFITALSEPHTGLDLLAGYPVLARLLCETLDQWLHFATDLLTRLCTDWEAIRRELLPHGDPGTLLAVDGGLGDRHHGGKSVQALCFSSGCKLLYKPRSLAVDRWFAGLLRWLRERGAPELRVPRSLDRCTYGWVEHVAQASCSTASEVEAFFVREGALLALLYAVRAIDLHAENLVAAGEHPVLVDLELLLGPELAPDSRGGYESPAERDVADSVMMVMLLPFLSREKQSREGVDISGMGGYEGQEAPVAGRVWQRAATDELQLIAQRMAVPVAANRAHLDGRPVHAFNYLRLIESGFGAMFELLRQVRNELLAPGGPLAAAAEIPVRVLLRPTRLYSVILDQSFHPDALRDAVDRDRLFDRLWFGVEESRYRGLIQQVVPAEKRQLWQGDIPYFHTLAGARGLWAASGECFPEVFSRSGLEMATARLQSLGDADFERQIWYIRSALATYAGRFAERMPAPYPAPRRAAAPPTAERLLTAAAGIARRLQMLACVSDDEASWVGLSPILDQGWRLQPMSADLYSGLPGVILFLAYYARVIGEGSATGANGLAGAEARRLAEQALASLRQSVTADARDLRTIGAFDGWGGLLYTWLHLAALWQRGDLLTEATEMLDSLADRVDEDQYLDLANGAAGAILPVLQLFRRTGNDAALRLAIRLGDRLIERAQPAPGGIGWPAPGVERRILTGLSHGGAGFAWPLTELFTATGLLRFRDTALAALGFEDQAFSATEGNWPDLRLRFVPGERELQTAPQFVAAWCNGATGIGLSRVRLWQLLGRPSLLRDVQAAVAATLRKGFGHNHCLCHGDLGSLELLHLAAPLLPPAAASQPFADRLAAVLSSIEANGCICGLPFSVESPGLMEGLAGIGYGLLRLAGPAQVPSILLLDPPQP